MSMLSMQIDRLRSCADLYDGTTKPEMAKELQRPHLAQELRKAADTIWELRDDLQRANAENAKLRELAKAAWGCVNRHVSCDECRVSCGGCTLQSAMHEVGVEVAL